MSNETVFCGFVTIYETNDSSQDTLLNVASECGRHKGTLLMRHRNSCRCFCSETYHFWREKQNISTEIFFHH